MKKLFIVLFCIVSSITIAQTEWQWQNPTPQGIKFNDVVYVNANTIYAAGEEASFFKSTGGGANWTVKILRPLNTVKTHHSLSISAPDVNHIYILMYSKYTSAIRYENNVLRSSDGGNTWDSSYVNFYEAISANRMQFVNNTTGYVYTNMAGWKEIYKSTNSGANWNKMSINSHDTLVSLNFLNENTGWATGMLDYRYYTTTNAGASWNTYTYPGPGVFHQPFILNGSTGWMISGTTLYKTTNGGINFSQSGTFPYLQSEYGFFNEQTGWAVMGNLYSTSNGGANWYKTAGASLVNEPYYTNASFLNSSTGIAVGIDGITARTSNGGLNWTSLSFSQNNYDTVDHVNMVNSSTGWALSNRVLLNTTNNGVTWTKRDTAVKYSVLEFLNASSGIAGGINSFSVTTNGGVSWVNNTYNGYEFRAISMNSPSTWFVYGNPASTGSGILVVTTNSGASWQTRSTFANKAYDIDFPSVNTGYLSTFTNGTFRSTDGGNSWLLEVNQNFRKIHFFDEIHGAGINGNTLYMKTAATWDVKFTPLSLNAGLSSFEFVTDTVGYLTGQIDNTGRIWKTTDKGETWKINQSFYVPVLRDVSFINKTTGWIVGTGGAILKTVTGGLVGVQQISATVPDKFYLQQNYPNPFNPNTNIEFSLPQKTFVKLKVFDLLGKEVGNLVNENLSAGKYKYDFNASALPSGIYFYKLETENFSETRKMMLVK
jgi:photosystem II stability/assembly factor-like uncharacterized protein